MVSLSLRGLLSERLLVSLTRALPVAKFTNWVPLIRSGYQMDEEFDEWFAEMRESEFDYVLDRNILVVAGDTNPRIDRFTQAVEDFTKDLTRVEYPSDLITIHER